MGVGVGMGWLQQPVGIPVKCPSQASAFVFPHPLCTTRSTPAPPHPAGLPQIIGCTRPRRQAQPAACGCGSEMQLRCIMHAPACMPASAPTCSDPGWRAKPCPPRISTGPLAHSQLVLTTFMPEAVGVMQRFAMPSQLYTLPAGNTWRRGQGRLTCCGKSNRREFQSPHSAIVYTCMQCT